MCKLAKARRLNKSAPFPQALYGAKTTHELWPPNPKEFEIAA